jgi:ribosomal-protein-alanine N-acetyltransferase
MNISKVNLSRNLSPAHMKLETGRLTIIPLSHRQLGQYLIPDALERALDLVENDRKVTPKLVSKIAGILPLIADPVNDYLFQTFWIVIDKTKKVMVADLCFKGQPQNGEVEIGYGTYDQFQGMGFMSEAVDAVINYVFDHTCVTSVYAETNIQNMASQKILERNRFLKQAVTRDNVKWRREK